MSRIISIPYTHTSDVVSFDSTNSTYYAEQAGYPKENGIGDGSGYYAGFDLTRGTNAVTNIYYNFNCDAIPNDATITSVSCYYRASVSGTNTKRIAEANIRLCAGTTAKGTAISIMSTTAQYYTVDGGNNWTVAEIKNCKIRGYAKRGNNQTSSQQLIRLFGGTLTVNYTVQGVAYTITATSEVDGETVSPATQEVYEGQSAYVNINNSDITSRKVTDNNTDVTNQLTYIPPDTGATIEQYPAGYTTGGSGTISGLHYVNTVGHSVSNPSSETEFDATTTGGTTAIIYYTFDFSDIPDSATISSMNIQLRYKVRNTNYAQSVNTYNGTSSKGTSVTLNSTSFTNVSISSPGTWTAAQLKDDPRIGITVSYSGVIVTGVTWSVTYTANEPAYYRYNLTNLSADHTIVYSEIPVISADHFYIKQNGSWISVSKIYLKQNGSWVEQSLTYLSDNNIKYLKQGT